MTSDPAGPPAAPGNVDRSIRRRRSRPLVTGRRGLTTRGRCLLAGGVAACVCAVILDERDLLRVGLLAALLPMIAWCITATRRTHLSAIHQVLPERLSPGMSGRVRLIVTNDGASRTRPIELIERATEDLSTGAHCLIPSLPRGHSAVTSYALSARRRGRFVVGPPQVKLGDPFGTWEDNRTLPVFAEVLVVPTVVPLQGSPTSGGSLSAASGRASKGTIGGDPDVAVRQYQRGDDIRTVHWRASARYDNLMVRLTEPVSHGGATVLLDHRAAAHRGAGVDSSLEVAVSLAASVALHLLGQDHHVRLVSHTGRVLAGGHDITDDVLAGLAVLTLDESGSVSPAAVSVPGLLIAILGQLDRASAALLIAAKRRSTNAVALILAADEWGGPPAEWDVGPQLISAGWRVVLIHPGDDLAMVWRRACTIGDGFASFAQSRERVS